VATLGGHDGQALAMQSPTPPLAGAFAGQTPSGTANAAAEVAALRVGRLDLLRGTARVVEAAPEVDGHLHWGGVKTHEARTVRLPRSITDQLAAT
jgi:hypothetical protein